MSGVLDWIADIVTPTAGEKSQPTPGDLGETGDNPRGCWVYGGATLGRHGAILGDIGATPGEKSPRIAQSRPEVAPKKTAPLLGSRPNRPNRPGVGATSQTATTKTDNKPSTITGVYRYRLTDRPDIWLTMLAPNCDADQARHALVLRFGADRLIEVKS